jgi:hypothetical protein
VPEAAQDSHELVLLRTVADATQPSLNALKASLVARQAQAQEQLLSTKEVLDQREEALAEKQVPPPAPVYITVLHASEIYCVFLTVLLAVLNCRRRSWPLWLRGLRKMRPPIRPRRPPLKRRFRSAPHHTTPHTHTSLCLFAMAECLCRRFRRNSL